MPADFRSHIYNALLNAWTLIVQLAPYVAVGILLGAAVSVLLPRSAAVKLLQGRRWWVLPLAALAGLISPACTMGTVPVFAAAIRSGGSPAPAATFLVASTLLNPQMFLLALGALGIQMAVAQATASMFLAVLIGVTVQRLSARRIDLTRLRPGPISEGQHTTRHPHKRISSRADHSRSQEFFRSLLDLTEFVGFYFVIGTVIAALAAEFVPPGLVMSALGERRWWAVPVSAIVSVPVYVCGGAMIPFLAVARNMGMASGAILAVLVAGPATRITALAALSVVFKKRAVLAYAILVLLFATILGFALSNTLALPASPLKGVSSPI
ncbi:MAG: permease [Armatimonadota bacterium]